MKAPDALRHRRWSRAVLAGALLLMLAAGSTGPAGATGQVGEPAANFSLLGDDGLTYVLDHYRGRVVMLFMLGYM